MKTAAPDGQNPICDVYVAAIPSDLMVEPVWPPEREGELRRTSHEERKKQRYFVWKLLEYAVCRSFDLDWKELTFRKDPFGKWSCDRFFFSLSPTGGVVAVAVSDGPVGIDIENIPTFVEKFRDRGPALLKKIATESEQEALAGEDPLAALDLWTKKESLFKCWGTGKFAPRKLDTAGQPVESFRLTMPAPVYLSLCGEEVAHARYYWYEDQSAHRMEPNQIVRTTQNNTLKGMIP